MQPILLATDLDRTILPNGEQPESSQARPLFRHLVRHPDITLLYITGRDRELIQQAITEFELPLPAYAIGDVGTSIYEVGPSSSWTTITDWHEQIAPDWQGKTWQDLHNLFQNISDLRLQQDRPAQQNTFKLSYYTDPTINKDKLLQQLQALLAPHNVNASLIFSIDEAKNMGLLDVLPKSATKLHALQFIRQHLRFSENRTVFCGDSGNDIPALTSGLNAVMVKNTRPTVQEEVATIATQANIQDRIYTAQGDFLGLNGNYTAGVLEGTAHFFPEILPILKTTT